MKEFVLVFRRDHSGNGGDMSPEQLQALMKPWQDWMGGIAAQDKIVSRGNRLAGEGRVVRPGNIVTNGPYVELKEAIGGFTVIRAESIDEAVEIAKGCPVYSIGGSVEVRTVVES